MTRRLRVLVVDDSATVRRHVVECLQVDPDLEVAGEARDGREAVDLACRLAPDVITMDLVMPGTSGLEATEEIMAFCATPILVVSAAGNRGEAFDTLAALQAGAIDALEKPGEATVLEEWAAELRARVKMVARVRPISHVRGRLQVRRGAAAPGAGTPGAREAAAPGPRPRALVALGGSTGAPAAVHAILRALPSDFPLPILLVVHIAPSFAAVLADWLDRASPLRVRAVRDGEPLPPRGTGEVIVPPPDRHLVVEAGRLRASAAPERHSCRPAVDVLFESVAAQVGAAAVACLLTGMGVDGAGGLLAVHRAGGETLAQDEATSVVFGMPRAAIDLGAVGRVLPLGRIAPALVELAAQGAPGGRP